MDRRSFLRSGGTTAIVSSIASEASAHQTGSELTSPVPNFAPSHRDRQILQSTLAPWVPSANQPWDVTTINHLYRRAGFGANLGEIVKAKIKTPSALVDALLDDKLLAPVPPPEHSDQWLHVQPYYGADYNQQVAEQTKDNNANMQIRAHWTALMALPESMLREKMVLFWMNHFVVESTKVYYPQPMYHFIDYFRRNAWGNFKQMVKDVTIAPAMLYYLDGVLNQAYPNFVPNENYARELQELFTMGITHRDGTANYTQDDIIAISHVLTGWTVDRTAPAPDVLPAIYQKDRHDSSFQKIYDGVNRQYNLDASGVQGQVDLIDHMFEKRADQIAWFMAKKMYQFFVYHEPTTSDETIVQELADTFKANWSVKEVVAKLLKSEHFFDKANIGAHIKSPYEHGIGMMRQFDIPIDRLQGGTYYYYGAAQSQVLLDPPNVKGWPGYHSWLSTTTLPLRGVIGTYLVVSGAIPAAGADGYGSTNTPISFKNEDVISWGKQFENYNGKFDDLLKEMAAFLCAQPIGPNAEKYVKSKVPPNTYEWQTLSDTDKITGLRRIANAIMLLAEYQLA